MVYEGTTLTLDIRGTTDTWLPTTPGVLRAAVLNALTPFFDVFDLVLDTKSTMGTQVVVGWGFTYTGVMTLQLRSDYGQAADVAAVVANAFYNAGRSIPTVTVRGYGAQQSAEPQGGPSITLMLGLLAVIAVAAVAWKVS